MAGSDVSRFMQPSDDPVLVSIDDMLCTLHGFNAEELIGYRRQIILMREGGASDEVLQETFGRMYALIMSDWGDKWSWKVGDDFNSDDEAPGSGPPLDRAAALERVEEVFSLLGPDYDRHRDAVRRQLTSMFEAGAPDEYPRRVLGGLIGYVKDVQKERWLKENPGANSLDWELRDGK